MAARVVSSGQLIKRSLVITGMQSLETRRPNQPKKQTNLMIMRKNPMPVKFKESATGRDKKSTHYYMRSTPLNELTAAFLASSTVPKRKQKIKNELVARRFDFATLIQE